MSKAALGYTAPHVPDPTIDISPLVEGSGGTFSIHYDHTYPVYDYMFVVSDTANTFSFMRYGFGPNQVIPDPIYWNGHTLDQPNPPSWSVVPAGDYNLSLSITYWTGSDVAVSQVRQIIHVRPAAHLRPVLFIHGVSSYPDMWQDAAHHNDYFALLESAGYPKEFLDSYHYSGVGVGENGYNNQGDIVEMAMGMDAAVNHLSAVSREYGGDGTVDIVCHSMGGLIARQYLLTHPTNHHIGKVISIGTPYQGSWLMDAESHTGKLRDASDVVARSLMESAGISVDPSNKAEQQMIPGSDFLQSIFNLETSPSVEYDTIYGNITMKLGMSIFGMTTYQTVSLGDGVVDTQSASQVSPNQPSIKYGFTSGDIINAKYIMSPGLSFGYNVRINNISNDSLKYFHTEITKDSGVQQRVEDILLDK